MVKIYMSFDFTSAKKRIEPNKVDKYSVQAEDYENINDLIRRSIRTKTKFKEDKVYDSEYDFDLDKEFKEVSETEVEAPVEQSGTEAENNVSEDEEEK